MADTKTNSKNVYQRLLEAQGHIVVPRQESRFKGGSRSAEAILEKAKPACRNAGLFLYTTEMVEFIGNRTRIKATAFAVNVDNHQECVEASASAWEGEISSGLDASQVSGKTGSYAKKYALQNLFAIDETKDADFEHEDAPAPNRQPAAPVEPPVKDEEVVYDDPLDHYRDELADLMRPKFTSPQIRAAMAKLTTEEAFITAIAKMKGVQ